MLLKKSQCQNVLLLLLLLSCFSRVRDPIDGSPPESSVPGILQARILEWVAISFSTKCPKVGEKKKMYRFEHVMEPQAGQI